MNFIFQLRSGAYSDETPIEFFTNLNQLDLQQVMLIWGGLPSHHSRCITDWIATQRSWLSVEPPSLRLRSEPQPD